MGLSSRSWVWERACGEAPTTRGRRGRSLWTTVTDEPPVDVWWREHPVRASGQRALEPRTDGVVGRQLGVHRPHDQLVGDPGDRGAEPAIGGPGARSGGAADQEPAQPGEQ